MAPSVPLQEIINTLELQTDDSSAFVNRQTGEILQCTDEMIRKAEEEEDESAPPWMREDLPQIREAQEGEPWVLLPSKFDIHEWEIMREFAEEQSRESARNELLNAIRGSGAFRMFREVTSRLGLGKKWRAFRDEALATIAREWAEENGIEVR